MDKARYSLFAGISLLATSVIFFVLPAILDLDAFVPVMIAIATLTAAVMFFVAGYSRRT